MRNNMGSRMLFVFCLALLSRFGIAQKDELGVFSAADIRYECLGNNEYQVYLDVYTECGYSNGLLFNRDNYEIAIESKKLGKSFSTVLLKSTKDLAVALGTEVKIFCEEEKSECDGGVYRGLRRYTFNNKVSFAGFGASDDWVISWARNNRSAEIETIIEKQPYRAEVTVNNLNQICNSSPVLGSTASPMKSVFTICKGEEKEVSLQISDANGDNLSYSIVAPLQREGVPVNYKSGFSASAPFGVGSSVSVSAGKLKLFSDNAANGVFDVLITETNSSGSMVGITRKSFQVVALECANEDPEMTGFDSSDVLVKTYCVGEVIRDTIYGSDSDGNKMRFVSNPTFVKSNPSARNPFFTKNSNDVSPTFKYVSTPQGYINFSPTLSDTGTFTFTLEIQDDNCPIQGKTTKEFKLIISPPPSFELGDAKPYDCTPFTFAPDITFSGASATYEWRPWDYDPSGSGDTVFLTPLILSTTPTVEVDSPSRLYLKVVDESGCEHEDYIDIFKSMNPVLNYKKYCTDQVTEFEDKTEYFSSSFVSRKWIVETSAGVFEEFTDEKFEIAYANQGTYQAELIIENDLGCIDTTRKEVVIVPHPELAATFVDSCSKVDNWLGDDDLAHGVDLVDLTEYAPGDGADSITWVINGISTPFSSSIKVGVPSLVPVLPDYPFPDSGFFQIMQITESKATCVDTLIDTIHIVLRPEIDLLTTSILPLNCGSPDTAFRAKLDDYFIGTAPVNYYAIDLLKDTKKLVGIVKPGDVFELPVNEVGTYQFLVEDVNGCDYYETVEVRYPLIPEFGYELQCSEGPIQFRDLSSSDNDLRPIVKWDWDFGDGNTSNQEDPLHLYTNQGEYNVSLTVTDALDCEEEIELQTIYVYPEKILTIDPDITVFKQCVNNTIVANNYEFQIGGERFVQSVNWLFETKNGSKQSFNYNSTLTSITPSNFRQSYRFIDTTSSLTITTDVSYALNKSNPLSENTGCYLQDTLSKGGLEVFPRFDGEILDNRVCVGDSGIIRFNRTVNNSIPIVSAQWTFTSLKDGKILASTTELEPSILIDKKILNKADQIKAHLIVEDANGCRIDTVKRITVNELSLTPTLIFDGETCQGQNKLYIVNGGQSNADTWEIYLNYNDLKYSAPINPPTITNPEVGRATFSIDEQGKVPVSVFFIENFSLENENECRSRLDTVVKVFDTPNYEIAWDTVCSSFPVVFENLSTIDPAFGTVLNYTWDFGDGTILTTPANQKTVTHQYQYGGYYSVRLSATTTEGCNDSYKVFEDIYVRPTPEIGFITDLELEAGYPITFTDNSETYGANIITSSWDFGDIGKFDNALSVTVQWDTVGIYFIKHAIETEEGCVGYEDSLRIDLNTYLELPTAFTPNGDGVNDDVGLISKSIRELYTFKIFNRWGQVVFDSEGDVLARWDGTFNGTPQEVGVYVVHVHALGAYDTEFNFKTNLKLIR